MRTPLARLSPEDRALLQQRLRTPFLTFLALLGLLSVNVTLGATLPFAHAWIAELAVVGAMVAIILLVSMEVRKEPPLIRLFSGLGFFWVCILFGMTLTDFLAR
jgi:cytochrome c oxidase subunit 4